MKRALRFARGCALVTTGIALLSATAAGAPPKRRRAKPRAHTEAPAPPADAPPRVEAAPEPPLAPAPVAPPPALAPAHASASQGEAPATSATAAETPASTAAATPSPATPALHVGGGIILYGYQPLYAGVKNNVELYFANLLLDGTFGRFGLHVEPRVRDTKLRPFFAGPAWIEEGYAYADLGAFVVKAGKEYSRLGLFWDNSFYGNVQSFDGLKLDPNYGLSVEGRIAGGRAGLAFYLQFFPIDGRTNISLPGRDTISIPGAFRRNQAIARVAPFFRLGKTATLDLGLSGEYFRADLPDQQRDVVRGAADATLTVGGFGIWAEATSQSGRSTTEFPYPSEPATAGAAGVPGKSSGRNNYVLLGTEITVAGITARYNFSWARYADVEVVEWIHEPGIGYAVNPYFSILAEFVAWSRSAPEGASIVDRSLNLTMSAHF